MRRQLEQARRGTKSPKQIAQDAADAARRLHSFRLNGTVSDAQGSGRLTAAIAGPGTADISLRRPSSAIEYIVLGSETYLKATRSYSAALSGLTSTQIDTVADRW